MGRIYKTLGEQHMKKIGNRIGRELPKGFGYCLIIFPTHQLEVANFISNAPRQDAITAMDEKIKDLKNKNNPKPPEETNDQQP